MAWQHELAREFKKRNNNSKLGALVGKVISTNPVRISLLNGQVIAQNNNYISVDQAKNIALGQAGFSASSVNFVKTKLENDDGRTEYEIEFYNGTTEYSYTIDAVTGSVLEYDVESIYD